MKLTPHDFRFSLIDEASHLLRRSIAVSKTHNLDARTNLWVVRIEAWKELTASRDFESAVQSDPRLRKELFGLPVRVTIDDAPDTPMIQLVMEPILAARP